MTFINSTLSRFMIQQAEGYDVTVPCHGIHLQPLFAVYSKTCVPAVKKSLSASRYKIVDFYPQVRVNYVNEEKLQALSDIDIVLFNVNTPVDLGKSRVIAQIEERSRESKIC